MSHSGILALGLAKEGFHQFWQFLDSAQGAECQPLHLVLGLDALPGHLPFDVTPDLFVGVQMRRVRRQVEQFEPARLGLDKGLDELGLVNRVTIDNYAPRLAARARWTMAVRRSTYAFSAVSRTSWFLSAKKADQLGIAFCVADISFWPIGDL